MQRLIGLDVPRRHTDCLTYTLYAKALRTEVGPPVEARELESHSTVTPPGRETTLSSFDPYQWCMQPGRCARTRSGGGRMQISHSDIDLGQTDGTPLRCKGARGRVINQRKSCLVGDRSCP